MNNNQIADFWSMLCSDDENIRSDGQYQWTQFFHDNRDYFENTLIILPNNFAQIYRNVNFHDFQILDIHIKPKHNLKSTITMLLYDFHEEYGKDNIYKIIYEDVSNYSINIKSTESRLNWANDIFEWNENE